MRRLVRTWLAAAATGWLMLLGGCAWLGPDENAYKQSKMNPPLEAPPEITLPTRSGAYDVPRAKAPPVASPESGQLEEIRIERDGSLRWLSAPMLTPEQAWEKVLAFWKSRKVALAESDGASKMLKTEWIETKAGIPTEGIKDLFKKAIGDDSDLVLRDQYRVRIEKADKGVRIYLTQRGAVLTKGKDGVARWQMRQPEPETEARMLQALQLYLAHSLE